MSRPAGKMSSEERQGIFRRGFKAACVEEAFPEQMAVAAGPEWHFFGSEV